LINNPNRIELKKTSRNHERGMAEEKSLTGYWWEFFYPAVQRGGNTLMNCKQGLPRYGGLPKIAELPAWHQGGRQ
jgi:hypothetical protein